MPAQSLTIFIRSQNGSGSSLRSTFGISRLQGCYSKSTLIKLLTFWPALSSSARIVKFTMAWPFKQKEKLAEKKSADFLIYNPFVASPRMQHSPEAFAKEGYIESAVVYACVRLIASACATVPLQIVQGPDGKVLPKHPMLGLMTTPNPLVSCHEFIEAAISSLLIDT